MSPPQIFDGIHVRLEALPPPPASRRTRHNSHAPREGGDNTKGKEAKKRVRKTNDKEFTRHQSNNSPHTHIPPYPHMARYQKPYVEDVEDEARDWPKGASFSVQVVGLGDMASMTTTATMTTTAAAAAAAAMASAETRWSRKRKCPWENVQPLHKSNFNSYRTACR